jgi:hypothetical protein
MTSGTRTVSVGGLEVRLQHEHARARYVEDSGDDTELGRAAVVCRRPAARAQGGKIRDALQAFKSDDGSDEVQSVRLERDVA